jgi:hypothetical protein
MGRPEEKYDVVEDCRRIEATWLKKHGYFKESKDGTITWTVNSYENSRSRISIEVDQVLMQMRLIYTQTSWSGEKRDMNYTHGLLTTNCNYGGKRHWFECYLRVGGVYCGRRVGVLYKPPGAWYWGCRHCHNLTYESRRDKYRKFALFSKIFKLDEMTELIKPRYWRGKPTKRYKKLLNFQEKVLNQRFDDVYHGL